MRLVEPERPHSQAAQRRGTRAPTERGAEVGGERPDVGAATALDQRGRDRVSARLELLDVEPVDPHVARCPFDFFALAELVQAAATDLHRRHHRRQLLDLPEEGPRALFDLVAVSIIGCWSSTAPDASSVVVAMPNTIRPRYALVVSWRKRSKRVALTEPDQ